MKKLKIFIVICLAILMIPISVGAISFIDTQGHWANYWIDTYSSRGFITGYPNMLFRPDNKLTREEAEDILERFGAAGLITSGDSTISREESIVAIAKAIEIIYGTTPDISEVTLDFDDNDTIDDWAIGSAKKLVKYGTLEGYPDNTVRGKNDITRAEFTKLLYEPTPEPTPEPIMVQITYEPNGGHGERFTDENSINEPYTIKSPEDLGISNPNHTFTGWNTVADGSGHQYGPGEAVMITSDLTLYAQWVLNKSQPPIINIVTEGDTVVTGSGIPGSQITVTFPNGSTGSATVASDGTWLINVPSYMDLTAGNVISANQTEAGKTVSDAVFTAVVGNPSIEPNIDIFVENLTIDANYARAGDTLLYDIIVSNQGGASSTWPSAYVTFHLGESVRLQENSIRINNRTANSSQYSYDSATNSLTLYLGNIPGGAFVSISYRTVVESNISNINETVLNAELGSL